MIDAPVPKLMLITDRRTAGMPLPDLATAAVDGGVDAVQVREKDLSTGELRDLVSEVRDAVAGRAFVLVNGDVDVARTLGVGLHLPEHASSVVDARRNLPGGTLVGRSVHDPEAAALEASADYLIAGHVYPTPSKPGLAALGLAHFADIVSAARHPVLAVGGIDAHVIGEVLARGAHGVAVISAISHASDPRLAALRLRSEIDWFEEGSMERHEASPPVVLTINGKDVVVPAGTTLSAFLSTKGLTERMVVVELNGTVLSRSSFASTVLRDSDRVEMVQAVGGG
jgi:thiazole tautomerase (transcriptional regulator TenI)